MSEKISKALFAAKISERLDLSKQQSTKMIDAIFKEIAEQLNKGNSVTLSGLGTLSIKTRAARTGRNPKSGQPIQLPESKLPHFKAAKELKQLINTYKVN